MFEAPLSPTELVLNGMSRYHLCIEALRRSRCKVENAEALIGDAAIERHRPYVGEHLQDMPDIRNWSWSATSP